MTLKKFLITIGFVALSSAATAKTTETIHGNYFGCTNKETFSRIDEYLSGHAGQITADCIWFSDGDSVVVTEDAKSDGLVKVSRGLESYWTSAEAVEPRREAAK